MPPLKILQGDLKFYGEIKPPGTSHKDVLKKPAPLPDPVTHVPLTNPAQREHRSVQNEKDPYSKEEVVTTISQDNDAIPIEELKTKDDLGSRFVSFLQKPIIETSETAKKEQSDREISRISGDEKLAPVINTVRPIGEVPADIGNKLMDFVENKLLNIILLASGIYLAGKFIEGSVSKKKSD